MGIPGVSPVYSPSFAAAVIRRPPMVATILLDMVISRLCISRARILGRIERQISRSCESGTVGAGAQLHERVLPNNAISLEHWRHWRIEIAVRLGMSSAGCEDTSAAALS